MRQGDTLVLRDIHQPPPPSWWPLAPGWWLVLAGVALLIGIVAWLAWRRRRRVAVLASLFDSALAQATTPAEKIAAMSELLRRAARRRDADADRLPGDEWLRFLDAGLKEPIFEAGPGAILKEGGYRRDVTDAEVAAVLAIARRRFLEWMTTP